MGEPADIAARFLAARRAATGLEGYPGTLPETLDEAYAIQDAAMENWGQPVLGWKVGRIMPPQSERFGSDRLAGPIFSAKRVRTDGSYVEMPVFAEGFSAAEAEFLLKLGAAPLPEKRKSTLNDTAALIDAIHIGIEIASSPLRAINEIGPIAVVSDFGNNNGLVIGPAIEGWRTSGFVRWPIATLIDGHVVGEGSADSFPEGPLGSARFLFELMARRGIALTPDQWVSTGAITGIHDVRPGQIVEARFGGEASVACRLVPATAAGGSTPARHGRLT